MARIDRIEVFKNLRSASDQARPFFEKNGYPERLVDRLGAAIDNAIQNTIQDYDPTDQELAQYVANFPDAEKHGDGFLQDEAARAIAARMYRDHLLGS